MELFLSLEDGPSRDAGIVGSKAAGLARAGSAGLPVLEGWVLPCPHGVQALREGVQALERSSAAARLAIAEYALEPLVLKDLEELAERFGGGAIVRSSAPQEADPRFSGAFATYLEVAGPELPAAVRGCWASAFTPEVLERCEAMMLDPGSLRIAVLIQPWERFEAGGTARVDDRGRVQVTATPGGPSRLVSGLTAGASVVVDRRGELEEDAALGGLDGRTLLAAAELARESARATGGRAIEWGSAGDDVFLLQVLPGAPDPVVSETSASVRDDASAASYSRLPAAAERLAELASLYPGPLGDRFVLPWAMAAGPLLPDAQVRVADASAALAEVRELAGTLAARAWGSTVRAAGRAAAETLRSVLGPDPVPGLSRLSGLRPVDPATATRLIGIIQGLGRALADRGVLSSAELVWRLTEEELASAIEPAGPDPPERLGPRRWDPFVFEVARTRGSTLRGTGVAPGIGAGRLRVLDRPEAVRRPGARHVLAVADPVPQVAPLLWDSSGLVALGGGLGAHLFEVTRSLGIPAVAGVDLRDRAEGALVAVDGRAGEVSVLERDDRRRQELGA